MLYRILLNAREACAIYRNMAVEMRCLRETQRMRWAKINTDKAVQEKDEKLKLIREIRRRK